MASKVTLFDRIEILRDGYVQVRLKKLIIDDDGVAHQIGGRDHFHRFTLPPGVTASSVKNIINNSLRNDADAGDIPDSEFTEIDAYVSIAHTPERIADYQNRPTQQGAQVPTEARVK